MSRDLRCVAKSALFPAPSSSSPNLNVSLRLTAAGAAWGASRLPGLEDREDCESVSDPRPEDSSRWSMRMTSRLTVSFTSWRKSAFIVLNSLWVLANSALLRPTSVAIDCCTLWLSVAITRLRSSRSKARAGSPGAVPAAVVGWDAEATGALPAARADLPVVEVCLPACWLTAALAGA